MTLEKFVAATLNAILSGVAEAQQGYQGTFIVLATLDGSASLGREAKIKFDVAVSFEEGTTGGGAADIKVLSLEIGGKAAKTKVERIVNRVQFEVPVRYLSK